MALALAASLWSAAAAATPPKAFVSGSFERILAAHRERPLILAFWSISCAYCGEELAMLSRIARRERDVALVLVSTDSFAEWEAVDASLAEKNLRAFESWIFAEDLPERLRFEIDRRWRGELPRTLLIFRDQRRVISGRASEAEILHWIDAAR